MIAALIIVSGSLRGRPIVGIVLAVTRTVPHRNRWIGGGVLAAFSRPVWSAACCRRCRTCSPAWTGTFTAAILIIAVVMLTWHNVWMARHGAELAGELREAGRAVVEGSNRCWRSRSWSASRAARGQRSCAVPLRRLVGGNDSGLSVGARRPYRLVLGALVAMLTYFGLVRIQTRLRFCDHHHPIALLAAAWRRRRVRSLKRPIGFTALDNVVWDSGCCFPLRASRQRRCTR